MSFLGMAFELSATDTNFNKSIDEVISKINTVSDVIGVQSQTAKKFAKEDVWGSVEKGVRRASGAIKNFDLDNVSNAIETFAVTADDTFKNLGNSVVETMQGVNNRATGIFVSLRDAMIAPFRKLTFAQILDGKFTDIQKSMLKTKKFAKALGGVFDLLIIKRLTFFSDKVVPKLKKGIEGLGKASKVAFKKMGDGAKKFGNRLKDLGGGISGVGGSFNNMMSGIQNRVMQFNVANIANQMKTLTGETGNLTNGIEAQFVSMQQSAKPIAAELDLTAKEMKKMTSQASSLAYSMNIGVDETMNNAKAMKLASTGAKKALDAMGLSQKDWAKITHTTGVQMEQYTGVLGDLTQSWGVGEKEAGKYLDQLVSLGKQAGVGLSPLKKSKEFLDGLDAIYASLPEGVSRTGDEIMSLAKSTVRLSSSLRELGSTPEEAIQGAQQMGNAFAEQSVIIDQALKVGNKEELSNSPLIQTLTTLTGDMDKSIDIIKTGSTDAVKGMQMINQLFVDMKGKGQNTQAAMAMLQDALKDVNPDLVWLATNTDKGTKALAQSAKMTAKATDTLKKYGKQAFSDGLTLQDRFNRAQEGFDTMVRAIDRKNVGKIVGQQMQGIREAGKEIQALGSDKTWGGLIHTASRVQQMGIGGLFTGIAESAGVSVKESAKFGQKISFVLDTINKVGDGLAPIMQMVGMTGPLGMLAAGGGILALLGMNEKDRKGMLKGFDKTFVSIKNKAVKMFKAIPWQKIGDGIIDGATKAFDWIHLQFKSLSDSGTLGKIGDKLKTMFKTVMDSIPWKPIVNGLFSLISDTFQGLYNVIPWTNIGNSLVKALKVVMPKIANFLKTEVDWKGVANQIFGVVKEIGSQIFGSFQENFGAMGTLFMGAIVAQKTGLLGIGTSMGKSMLDVVSGGGSSFMGKAGLVGLAAYAGWQLGSMMWDAYEKNEKKKGDLQAAQDKQSGKSIATEVVKPVHDMYRQITKGGWGKVGSDIATGKGNYIDEKYLKKKDVDLSVLLKRQDSRNSFAGEFNRANKKLEESGKAKEYISLQEGIGQLKFLAKNIPALGIKLESMTDRLSKGPISKKDSVSLQNDLRGIFEHYIYKSTGGDERAKAEASLVNKAIAVIDKANSYAVKLQSGQANVSKSKVSAQGIDVNDSNAFGTGSINKISLQPDLKAIAVGGKTTSTEFANGISEGTVKVQDAVDATTKIPDENMGSHSPISEGVLAGTGMKNSVYRGGYWTMEQFGDGIMAGTEYVRSAVENALYDSVFLTLDEYQATMEEWSKNQTFMTDLANQMIKDLTGVKIENEVNPEYDVDVKKNFKASMSLPGLSGLTLAVVNEGSMTRKVLGRMLEEQQLQTGLLQGGSGNKSGSATVLQP